MQTSITRLAAITVVALGIWTAPASAQDRRGFTIGFGGGFGSADATCDDCGPGDRENGGAGYLKLGWGLSERVIIGGEFNAWAKKLNDIEPGIDTTIMMFNASATVTFYPQARSGFFVKGGAGAALLDQEIEGLGMTVSVDLGRGFGVLVGAGYDIRLGRRFARTPAITFWYGQIGDLQVGGDTLFRGWKQNVVDVTIGVTIF